jgi:ubiquinone/menaquinone biosynthesis C-methylase UbiE
MKRVEHECEAFAGKFTIAGKELTATKYVEDHLKFKKIYGDIADKIISFEKNGSYLEVGAGGGLLASLIALKNNKLTITATDLSPDMVKIGENFFYEKNLHDRIKYVHGRGDELDFKGEKFDVIYSSFSFNYWKNPEKVLKNLLKHVKENGVIYITEFRRVWWVNLIPRFIFDYVPVIKAGYVSKEVDTMLSNLGVKKYKIEKVYPISLAFTIYN